MEDLQKGKVMMNADDTHATPCLNTLRNRNLFTEHLQADLTYPMAHSIF